MLSLADEQGAETLGAQLVDADDGLGEGGGELATGNEVLGLLHHHAHLLEVVRRNAVEAARVDDKHGALDTDARHTEDVFVGGAVDVHREELRMA